MRSPAPSVQQDQDAVSPSPSSPTTYWASSPGAAPPNRLFGFQRGVMVARSAQSGRPAQSRHEIDPMRLRPHPYEVALYFKV